jgi:hypothetical protein
VYSEHSSGQWVGIIAFPRVVNAKSGQWRFPLSPLAQ